MFSHRRIPAQHEFVKNKTHESEFEALVHAPAYPHTGPRIFTKLRTALSDVFGFQLSFGRLAWMIGETTSKTHYWFNVFGHPHVVAFLCLLERLPDRQRQDILNLYCRELPTLDHCRLAHDPIAVANLESLLQRTSGLTLLRGGTDFQRTFVVTAMGHSFQCAGRTNSVAGLDVHEPRKWVPLEKVLYVGRLINSTRLNAVLCSSWERVRASNAQLMLFNGIWSVRAGAARTNS